MVLREVYWLWFKFIHIFLLTLVYDKISIYLQQSEILLIHGMHFWQNLVLVQLLAFFNIFRGNRPHIDLSYSLDRDIGHS